MQVVIIHAYEHLCTLSWSVIVPSPMLERNELQHTSCALTPDLTQAVRQLTQNEKYSSSQATVAAIIKDCVGLVQQHI